MHQPTGPMPPGYIQYDTAPVGPPPRSGLLLAAGILAILEALPLIVLGALAALVGADGGMFGDLVMVLGLMSLSAGTLWLVVGIGGVARRQWGRVLLIIGNGLVAVVSVPSMVRDGGTALPLLLAVVGLGLAIAGRAWKRR